MSSKLPHFAIRVDRALMDKLKYIAESNARSANREIEMLIRKHVADFESKHGKIEVGRSDIVERG